MKLFAAIMSRPEVTQLLGELVSIESPSSQEAELAQYIEQWCTQQDIPYQVIEGNILITMGKESAAKHLLMNAHMDVVSGKNWANPLFPAQAPFQPMIHGQRLYGRGAADTKSGLASMLIAARDLYHQPELRNNIQGQVSFLFSRAEEGKTEFNGVRKVLEQGKFVPSAAVIAEPSNLEVLLGSGGLFHFNLTGIAKSAAEYELPSQVNFELLSNQLSHYPEVFPAIDRFAVFALFLKLLAPDIRIINVTSDQDGYSFRPQQLIVELSDQLTNDQLLSMVDEQVSPTRFIFKSAHSGLTGHPAYAHYDQEQQQLLVEAFSGEYLASIDPLHDVLNIMLFRARQKSRQHLSQQEQMFQPLPNLEFTSLTVSDKLWTINVGCRTSPEVDNAVVDRFAAQSYSKYQVTSSPYRTATYTQPDEEIAQVAAKVVQEYKPDQYPFGVQLGASDGQIMRDIFPLLPLILLSAGSGVVSKPGSLDVAPTYLSTSHQPDEFVDLAQLSVLPQIYHRVVLDYLK